MTTREKIERWNNNFCEWRGLNENGEGFVVLGNTYEIKDELKKHGAKFTRELGWVLPHDIPEFPSFKISLHDIANIKEDGKYIPKENLYEIISEMKKSFEPKVESNSEWVGTVGKKYGSQVVCTKIHSFYTVYGESYLYTFEDANENILIWSTGKFFDFKEGKQIFLYGTVKAHSEYRGVKQTRMTRCSIDYD